MHKFNLASKADAAFSSRSVWDVYAAGLSVGGWLLVESADGYRSLQEFFFSPPCIFNRRTCLRVCTQETPAG